MKITIRKGEKRDLPALLGLIKELAEYEKSGDSVTNSLEMLEKDGFGKNAIFSFFVAEVEEKVVGIALYYPKYSTWKGRGIYLDDIVVTESFRRMGVGKLLFDKVIEAAKKEGANLLWWQVLDWNEPAIRFYQKYQAKLEAGWWNGVLLKEDLARLK